MTDDVSLVRTRIEQLARAYQRVVQKERAAERRRLEDYRAKLAVLEEQYAQAKPAPPRPLTIPAIFGSSYRENFISDYLAYALDPAKNGIGEAPLLQLLHLCGLDVTDLPIAEVTVHREYPLETGQIDFLLEWEDTLVLGIENKILSSEGKEQTVRYARAFRRQFKDTHYHLVYLTREGQRAGSRAFQPVSYAQLVAAFREVQVADEISDRQRVLWKDLLEHLEVYIVMSDPTDFEFSEKAQLYLEHQKIIEDLTRAWDREWGEALSYIERQLYSHLDGGPWTTTFRRAVAWQQVFKPVWRSSQLAVYYQYLITAADLNEKAISFMAQTDEWGLAKQFMALFEQRYPDLEDRYRERDITYRPPHRRKAIAWKQYAISQDVDDIARVFIEAFAEFRFLEAEIDQVLAELQKP